MAKKRNSEQVIPRSVIIDYDEDDLPGEANIADFVMDGIHQVEWEGDLQDPYIRSKKVVCHLRDFLWGDGYLHASVVPREGDKTLPENWRSTHEFKAMTNPRGKIIKLVLVPHEDEE